MSVTLNAPLQIESGVDRQDELRGRPELHRWSQESDPTRMVKDIWSVPSDVSPPDSPATTPTAASFPLSNSIQHVQPRVRRRLDSVPGGLSGCGVLDI